MVDLLEFLKVHEARRPSYLLINMLVLVGNFSCFLDFRRSQNGLESRNHEPVVVTDSMLSEGVEQQKEEQKYEEHQRR